MMLIRIAIYEPRKSQVPFLVKSYDMRNPCGTGKTERLIAAHRFAQKPSL